MSHNKDIFFRAMLHLARRFPLSQLVRQSGKQLMVPLYHLVNDRPPPHVKHLYKIKSEASFERELDTFLQHYHPISVEDLIDHVYEERPLLKNSFLLTFDDGLREFKEVAAPILNRKGIPAICFLNSE